MSKEIKSGIQEGLRTSVLAMIGLLIAQLGNGSVDLRLVAVAGLIGLLRGVERVLYKLGYTTGLEIKQLD